MMIGKGGQRSRISTFGKHGPAYAKATGATGGGSHSFERDRISYNIRRVTLLGAANLLTYSSECRLCGKPGYLWQWVARVVPGTD
jgi:hypothetical protein